jgi:hypothetical protein
MKRLSSKPHSSTWLPAAICAGTLTLSLSVQPQTAVANDATLQFTTPTNTKTNGTVTIKIDGAAGAFAPITIPPGQTAQMKRDLILAGLQNQIMNNSNLAKFTIIPSGTAGITVQSLGKGTEVSSAPGNTGEPGDKVTALAPLIDGSVIFGNTAFAALDSSGNPSTFTAGVDTDLGQVAFTIPSTSLPSLDGATIASVLFADLAPEGPSHGFGVTVNGDELDFTFNPALTTMGGGVVFGTTAPTDGLLGSLTVDAIPEAPTWAMMLLGFAALGFAFRQSRRKVSLA